MWIDKLKRMMEGEVRDDPVTRRVYSVDASIYEVEPKCVVTPRNKEDVIKVVRLADEEEVSIIPRGAGTGITGGCLGAGIVLDLSKYMNRILKVDFESQYVVCEPGVVQDRLNDFLFPKGYRLGPDTSTGNRATLGGMLANNAAGARSLKYGRMVDDVLEVELILSNGQQIQFREFKPQNLKTHMMAPGIESAIYKAVAKIREDYSEEIKLKFPKIPRRASGYNLDELIKPRNLNCSKIIAGSEGTLGIATEIKMKIVPLPKRTGLCLVHFTDMLQGMESVPEMLLFRPIALEVMDTHIISMARQSPSVQNKLEWLEGNPEAIFAIEIEEETERALSDRLASLADFLK